MRARFIGALLALAACDPSGPSVEQADPRAQPGATVVPLETANLTVPDGGVALQGDGGVASGDAAPPAPEPFGVYEQLPADRLGGPLSGLRIRARWRPRTTALPEVPDATRESIEKLREATHPQWSIEIAAAGRMRVELDTRGQPFPRNTALMARADRYGTALVWPNGTRYRVLAPGSLRNAIGERRADVAPLTPAVVEERGRSERLGFQTRKLVARSSVAEVALELVDAESLVSQAGRGAPLLCRMILEIAGAEPGTDLCNNGLLVDADISWLGAQEGAGIRFEVVELRSEEELAARRLHVPPSRARFVTSGLPGNSRNVVLTGDELDGLRAESSPPAMPPADNAPEEGLLADNQSDHLLFLLLDGIVVASVPPWENVTLATPKQSRYTTEWRSFWETRSPHHKRSTCPHAWSSGRLLPKKQTRVEVPSPPRYAAPSPLRSTSRSSTPWRPDFSRVQLRLQTAPRWAL